MRKLLLTSCAVIALGVVGGVAQAADTARQTDTHGVSGNTKISVDTDLKDSVLGNGSLSEATTHTHTVSYTTTASGAAGSSFNTASLTGNKIQQYGGTAGYNGSVSMTNSMGGQGILQASQNTGSNAVQQNSVALTSTVGGNGGGLSGFSPSYTTSAR
jgi:hypothetical protein